ncbi:hypothetical protein [Novosphingobium sp. 11B]
MEVFINAQTDRQAAYEQRRRKEGQTRVAVWVPSERAEELKEIARAWCAEKAAKEGQAND